MFLRFSAFSKEIKEFGILGIFVEMLRRKLKIRVSVVQFRPWAPLKTQ
jgi:hypothetical protein